MPTRYIYLDYAAATPVSDTVRTAMEPYFQADFYNPSATYMPARNVKAALDKARQTVAETIGARAAEITFTAGGTEANNLAIHGVMAQYPEANMVTTVVEHESVLEPAKLYKSRAAAVNEQGIVDVESIMELVDDHTVLVSVMYANNEVGSVQPIRALALRLAELRKQRKREGNTLPLYMHTDAAQAANYLDLHVARLGVDLMSLNGGKIYGPKQSGALYVRGGVRLVPLLYGGGQEQGIRSGTENVAASIGFAAALQEAQALRQQESARLSALQRLLYEALSAQLPTALVNGSKSHRLPNNVHLTVPGTDNERVLLQLEEAGILAAAGSACSASNDEPSHVLRAMGLTEAEAQASLRFTMGRHTSEQDVHKLVAALMAIVA